LLVMLFFMLLRGMFEISGLFSYAEGAIDAVAMMAVALNLPRSGGPLRLFAGAARTTAPRTGARRNRAP
jgi:hypothetical protein